MLNRKFKLTGGAATAVVIVASLTACGNDTTTVTPAVPDAPAVTTPGDTVTGDTAAAGDPCADVSGTVTLRWWGSDSRAALQAEAMDKFMEIYPNITVQSQPSAFQGYWDQLQIEGVAGTTPDVYAVQEAWVSSLVTGGVVADLSQEPTLDLSHFSAGALGVGLQPDGQVFGVPTGGTAQAILVNYSILEDAGIPIPDDATWTWDDFVSISQQVTDAGLTTAGGQPIFGNAGLTGQGPARIRSNQTDGGMFTYDDTLNWSEASMADWLALMQGMVETGAAAPASVQAETFTGPAETLLAQGRVAFQALWANQMPTVAGAAGTEIGLLRFPGDSTSAHVGTWLNPSMFWVQSANAQYPAAAACLINFMVNDARNAEIMGIDRGVPFNADMAAVVEPRLTVEEVPVAAFMSKIAGDAVPSGPLPELSDDLQNIFLSPTESVLFGLSTPAQGAVTLRNALEDAIVR
ncbi:MAG: extracellular solute-binding protein [Promicromonosporaceae bacterium]|nr:extracellular solute-binding protein [Promicromonosporaceae bacterium]